MTSNWVIVIEKPDGATGSNDEKYESFRFVADIFCDDVDDEGTGEDEGTDDDEEGSGEDEGTGDDEEGNGEEGSSCFLAFAFPALSNFNLCNFFDNTCLLEACFLFASGMVELLG